MKVKYILGIFVIIMLATHLAAGSSLTGLQDEGPAQNSAIENAILQDAVQNTMSPGKVLDEDQSIFSKNTIITLIFAVAGIVAFRRNTYS